MQGLVVESERALQAIGQIRYVLHSEAEKKSKAFRRSLYAVEDIAPGEVSIDREERAGDDVWVRVGAEVLETVLGMRTKAGIARGTALNWDLLG